MEIKKSLRDRIAEAVMDYHRDNSEHAYDPEVLIEAIMYEIEQ